jgi:DNA helicase HerA-like ATPase
MMRFTAPFAYVTAVEGASLTGLLHQQSEDGKLRPSLDDIQIGNLIKIPTHRGIAFGLIASMIVQNTPLIQGTQGMTVPCSINISLLGEIVYKDSKENTLKFRRGISSYPPLYADIFLAEEEDLMQVYARPNEPCFRVGTLHQNNTIPAYILSNRLISNHFAVIGTTGTGKSCAVALLLHSILDAHPQGRVLLLDPHKEYAAAFGEKAEIFDTETLQLPYWLLNSEELNAIFVDKQSPTAEKEAALLRDAVVQAKILYNMDINDPSAITVDNPLPYQLRDVLRYIDEKQGELDQPNGHAPYLRLKSKINQLKSDSRYKFIFTGLRVDDTFAQILSKILRLPVNGKPIAVFNLADVPTEIVDVVVSIICRLIFDFSVHTMEIERMPLLLVCEEAHRYIPRDESKGFGQTRALLSRIAQEGRKYGIGICLVTQRPSLISETIISQCNTLITLRMSNDIDQAFVKKFIPETAMGMMNALPALRNQEAIISGEGVTLPMRVTLSDLPSGIRPRSETVNFSEFWARDTWTDNKVQRVINKWRHQDKATQKSTDVVSNNAEEGLRAALFKNTDSPSTAQKKSLFL